VIAPPFRVGVTRDLLSPDGTGPIADIGLDLLDARGIDWTFLSLDVDELNPQLIDGFDAVFVGGPRVTARSIVGSERLVVLARFGVGYEKIDLDACTRAGVLVTITPDAVRRPVAVAALTLLLSLSQNLRSLDHLTRGGRWRERANFLGVGLVGRTIGAVGLGNIGQELFRLIEHFGMRRLAYDPYVDSASARAVGAELVELDVLCRDSDFIVVMCALTPQTHHLLDAKRLELMKKSALIVNVARGAVIDQTALTAALRERRIRGAGLDVFEQEPIDPADPLLSLDNVLLTPHALCSTDQCLHDCGASACASIVDIAVGRIPEFVVNRGVLDQPALLAKLASRRRAFAT
jgi:phosphoglycerate dehydrogenase-like enzyme